MNRKDVPTSSFSSARDPRAAKAESITSSVL